MRAEIPSPSRVRPEGRAHDYARDLESSLQARIEGEVRFDAGARALYSTDASNYRQTPIGVVIPRHVEDIIETVALCRQYGAPILPRGGGTSLAGQCCNVAVVIDCSKYMREVIAIDPKRKTARVQPGCVLDHLREEARPYKLTFAPDPATHNHCTLGGMIGNNSCGVHSVMGGRTDENIEQLEVLTYDGARMHVGPTSDAEFETIRFQGGRQAEIYAELKRFRDKYASRIRERYPEIPRRVSGYNLPWLLPEKGFNVARALVGSEGTLALVLEATLRLLHNPEQRTLVVLGYPDVYEAADDVPEILEYGPIGLEGLDNFLIENLKARGLHTDDVAYLPEGKGFLLIEFGGDSRKQADAQATRLVAHLKRRRNAPNSNVYSSPEKQQKIWEIRESGLGATAFVPGQPPTWPGWEDSAVPPEKAGDYLRDLRNLFHKFGYRAALYGHFGQGCIHTRIPFDLVHADGIAKYREFIHEAAALCLSFGGSFSGEHGDGQARGELLPMMFGPDLVRGFLEYKAIWDPREKMNPGKVVAPYRMDENLKLGADYNPPEVETHFRFPVEGGWSGAANRCVGVGKCRRTDGGTMCPSYMVTLEEEHSTRGRSRMLFEMLEGETIHQGWKSDEVFDALDLCLACKGCKGDCPVKVDMATYKAEFLSHYYEGRLRPRHAYAMGLIMYWARLAAKAPHLVNFATHAPGLSHLVKAAGGIAQQRKIPRFAPQTFKDWFARREPRNIGKREVILWPDTFNTYFTPRVGQAAVEVLEDAGFRVSIPDGNLCCGRPLYDYGMLDHAKHFLREILHVLQPAVRAGIPIVGLEPSCVAVFRDELCNLFPDDEDAKRLGLQTFTLAEFLGRTGGYVPPPLHRKALVHGHCHQKAVVGMGAETRLFERMGLEFELMDSGCCGMAGSFGYERDKYELSMQCGERKLFPAIREAPKKTLLIADGFSCRSQVQDGTKRQALHLAQVLQMAKHEGERGPRRGRPEQHYVKMETSNGAPVFTAVAGGLVGAALLGAGLFWLSRTREE